MTDGEEVTDANPSDDCKSMCKALQELHSNGRVAELCCSQLLVCDVSAVVVEIL